MITMGERIRKIRQEKGLSQKELGDKLGVSQQMIGQWETGKSNPKIESIKKIASALKVSFNILMPDSNEYTQRLGDELSIKDFSLIEALVNHTIFSDDDRETIFKQIEEHRVTLSKMKDVDEMQEYSYKANCDLEDTLLQMILAKYSSDISDIIIILSCFFSLKSIDQSHIIELLSNNCYPNIELKYDWEH